MNSESINYLFEVGTKGKQEDYIWPVAGEATGNDKVFIVCDGSGNFYNGGAASKLICQFMAAKVSKFGEQRMSGELIDKLLIEARDRLITYAREYRLDTDMATTFSMVILYDQRVFVSWYGDSRIYHLRGGEILFSTGDNGPFSEQTPNAAIARGIKADSSPIQAETKWIEDVEDGDYFLLCSKGLVENIKDDDIKRLVSQNDKTEIDLTGSFRRLAFEKATDNYSMYLIRVNTGTQKREISNGIGVIKKQSSRIINPISILAMTIVALFIMVFYFRAVRTSDSTLKYKNQTTQPVDVRRDDSVHGATVTRATGNQPIDVLRDDSVPNAIVISVPRKPIPVVADSVKNKREEPQAAPQNDNPPAVQAEEKPEQESQLPVAEKKRVAQLMVKITTDESCKLKIKNLDLDDVIDWDLSPNDNGTIYLKPGKYSIVATSVVSSTKSKTYNFDVKPGHGSARQSIHITF